MSRPARLDLAAHQAKPFVAGAYKLTLNEGAALMDKVRASMTSDQFGRLSVPEVLGLYQQQKARFLIRAMALEPERFAAKATS